MQRRTRTVCTGLTLLASAAIGLSVSATTQSTARPPAQPPVAKDFVMLGSVDHVDDPAREPMVVAHRDGSLFVAGYGADTPRLWKSRDRGATWTRVNVGSVEDGARGNSDVDLAIARDGTLYFMTMGFDRKTNEGTFINMGVSKDAGATWRWTTLSQTRFDDRPWVEVAPDGTAHAIWNDGSGVNHRVSHNGGTTWTPASRIHPEGGSSHMAIGPQGQIAVRITPLSASGNKFHPGVDLIAVSSDGGKTWDKHPAPGKREWSNQFDKPGIVQRWVEPIAWDGEAALYSFWTDMQGIWLARSTDRATTWTTTHLAESKEIAYFPYLIARGPGELAASWFAGEGAKVQAHVAIITGGDGKWPAKINDAAAFTVDSWRRGAAATPRARDTAGEYFPVMFAGNGTIAAVTTIQNDIEKRYGFSWRTFGLR